jgi:hypothetical protein
MGEKNPYRVHRDGWGIEGYPPLNHRMRRGLGLRS